MTPDRSKSPGDPRDGDGRRAPGVEGWHEVHEACAERFDVDPEIGRRAMAQHHPELE